MHPELTGTEPSIASGRYVLTGRLGTGGMAQVFRAWDTSRECFCAVKVMASKLSTKKSIRQRFAREADAMRRMDHPNVVKIIDVDLDAKLPFLVMEIAEGGSLESWTQAHGAMPPQMVVDVTLQIAAGIGAAHANGIVHRDLKPPNVLIDRDGVCRVSDFGIAQVKDTTNLTGTGHAMGTWLYMPPEQRLNAKEVDERGDIYNIGVVMYSLITGAPPPDLCLADNDPRVLEAIDQPLRDVVDRCVKFLPEDRYQAVAGLIEALEALQESLPALVDPPNLAQELMTEDLDRQILLEINTLLDRPLASQTLVATNEPGDITDTFALEHAPEPPPTGTIPDYLDSSDLTDDAHEHQAGVIRAPTLPPLPPEAKVSLLRRLALVLTGAGLLVMVPVSGMILMIFLGIQSVNAAANTTREVAESLLESVDSGILDDLEALGADKAALSTARATFESSEAGNRHAHYIAGIEATAAEFLDDNTLTDPIRVRARTRMKTLHSRLTDLEVAQSAWQDAASDTTGKLAVLLSLADGPAPDNFSSDTP